MRGHAAATLQTHGIGDLRYRLIAGPADLEPLRVLACRSLLWHGWEVRPMILGASHAVVFRRGDEQRAELLTCAAPPEALADRPNSSLQLLLTMPADDVPEQETALPTGWLPGVTGSVRLSRFDLAAGDTLHIPCDLGSIMSWDFPASEEALGNMPPPRTRIGWRVREISLEIETVHTYPEVRCGIRSETRILLTPRIDEAQR